MSQKIYKYVGPEHFDKVFCSTNIVTLKCSLPKDFNDPYELFLTINFNERPDALAYYADAIGELPQLPTTCFSRSPSVVPMWAHYAQGHQGFAIEFSEESLVKAFPESGFGDVDYLDSPREDLTDMLYRSYVIGKPRYTYFLQNGVFSAAYYTKASCWSYEQERRMIVHESEIRLAGPLTLIDVPGECITSLICGSRASAETKDALMKKSEELNCQYLELRIGRSSATPYFINTNKQPFSFDGTKITPSSQYCGVCKEPLEVEAETCSWCQINDVLREYAASRNPYRMLAYHGMLLDYIKSMNAIGKKHRKS